MIGKTLGHYRIDSQIGEGAMGKVYKAHDTLLERTVAIKLLTKRDDDASYRERLLREARNASALNHPNICAIYDVGLKDDLPFMVMEYIEGRTMSKIIPTNGLPIDSVIRYGVQIADALAHAHERGIVHRDLKSGNLIVREDDRVKVLDFGIATQAPDVLAEAVTQTYGTTLNDVIVGTLAYMAPELLKGAQATLGIPYEWWGYQQAQMFARLQGPTTVHRTPTSPAIMARSLILYLWLDGWWFFSRGRLMAACFLFGHTEPIVKMHGIPAMRSGAHF